MNTSSEAEASGVELTCPRCRDSLNRPGGDPASAHTMGRGCVAERPPGFDRLPASVAAAAPADPDTRA